MNDITNNNQPENKNEQPFTIPLKWELGDNLNTIYANQAIISHAGPEFYLIFGEAKPSINLLMGQIETVNDLPSYIPIQPVVKIALPPEAMLEIAEAIQRNVKKYLEQFPTVESEGQ